MLCDEPYLTGTEYVVAVGESGGCQGFGKGLAAVDPAAHYLPCVFGAKIGYIEHAELALAVGADDEYFRFFCVFHNCNYLICNV